MPSCAYYNEIDPYAAQWLRNLITAGHIALENFTTKNITLNHAAAWATPCQRDYRCANLKPFSGRGGGKKGEQLNNQVAHQVSGQTPNGSTAETVKKGQLNPAFSLWLMGFPAEWENCAPQATPLSRNALKK